MNFDPQYQVKFHIDNLYMTLEKLPNTNLKFTFKETNSEMPQGFDFEMTKKGAEILIADLQKYLAMFPK